jgi:peptide deformylase
MKLDLRYYGDPVLREKARAVPKVDGDLRGLAEDMIETMRANAGCGLAAQQVGHTESICVIEVLPEQDTDKAGVRQHPELSMPMALVNPEIIDSSSKTDSYEEGCLSFPDVRGSVPRSLEVTVRFLDLQGQPREMRLRGFLARVVQHEIDHLNGVLFIDRMSAAKRIALSGRLRKLKRETEEGMGVGG